MVHVLLDARLTGRSAEVNAGDYNGKSMIP
jgi:hypothetical protein